MTLLLGGEAVAGPYAPAAGQTGSTAIPASSADIEGWATGYTGFSQGDGAGTSNPSVPGVSYTPSNALGAADANPSNPHPVIPLGRAGTITLTFDAPVGNGEGYDFAVFENAVNDLFLELAVVEVSSNGTDFFGFETVSLTPSPVSAFGSLDTTDIHNFAGKYRATYGTTFELSELHEVSPLLDIFAITHIRITDVVGDGNTTDSQGNPVYDPYATSGTAGFDLDAVGAMHFAVGYGEWAEQIPNPALRGALDDPDGDRCLNLEEFTTGGNPNARETETARPAISINNQGEFVVTHRRDTSAHGVAMAFQSSESPDGSWTVIAHKPVGGGWIHTVQDVGVTESLDGLVSLTDRRSAGTARFYQFTYTLPSP